MKIYTKTGDRGFTSLFGGTKVSKADPRLAAYGDCDELNSALGWALTEIRKSTALDKIAAQLQRVQSLLFVIGGRLACDDAGMRNNMGAVSKKEVLELENQIDEMTTVLPELKNFILPGGSEASSRFHMARSLARRTERSVLAFYADNDESDENIIVFLNRLSDYLFTCARYANFVEKLDDVHWISGSR